MQVNKYDCSFGLKDALTLERDYFNDSYFNTYSRKFDYVHEYFDSWLFQRSTRLNSNQSATSDEDGPLKRKVRKAKKRRIKSEAAATKKTVDGAANVVKQILPSEATHMEKSSKKVEPDDNNKTGMLTQYILCL